MAKLIVYEKELKRAFRKNLEAAECLLGTASVCSGLMLLFYAVECGLKHLLCTRTRGSYMEGEGHLRMSHNLSALVKELKFSSDPLPLTFRVNRNSRERYSSAEAHLAWRYGVDIHHVDQATLQSALNQLVTRIKEDIE